MNLFRTHYYLQSHRLDLARKCASNLRPEYESAYIYKFIETLNSNGED